MTSFPGLGIGLTIIPSRHQCSDSRHFFSGPSNIYAFKDDAENRVHVTGRLSTSVVGCAQQW